MVPEKVNSDVTSGYFTAINIIILKVVHNCPAVKLQGILILSDNWCRDPSPGYHLFPDKFV